MKRERLRVSWEEREEVRETGKVREGGKEEEMKGGRRKEVARERVRERRKRAMEEGKCQSVERQSSTHDSYPWSFINNG